VWVIEWLAILGRLHGVAGSIAEHIYSGAEFMSILIHNVVNREGLWQIEDLNTYFWEDSLEKAEMLSHYN
jgi:hypothetical protein